MNLSPFLRPLLAATVLLGVATVARAEASTAPTPPAVDHYVHLRFLPKASELAQDAKMNNLTILRIDELADRVIVSYKYPDGHTATLGYVLLGSEAGAKSPGPVTATTSANVSTARYTVADRDPEVVYVSRPATTHVYYTTPYYSPYYYNPWAPFTVGVGVGWASGYYGGHYYRGGHHHHGGHHRAYYGGHRGYRGGHGRGHR